MITADLPLFAQQTEPVRLHRAQDTSTAVAAAATIARTLSGRQEFVLQAFRVAGPDGLTDRELETQSQFTLWAPSTARKRRSELFHMGYLEKAGERDGLTVWRLA